ncbi:uncharacterized protein [Lolium perenne]|uniref:uncharacterized protein isoform X4 n=1 Tax=Lolium perenne TaxID=4522 RepID=UPI003A99825F
MPPPLALSPLTSPPTEPSRVLNHAAPQTLAAPLPALAPAHEDGADRSTDFWSHPELFQTLAPEDDHAATSRRASIRHPSEPLLVHGNHQGRRRRASSGTAASPAYWRDHPGPWTRPFRDLQDLGPKPHLHAAVLEHILPPQRSKSSPLALESTQQFCVAGKNANQPVHLPRRRAMAAADLVRMSPILILLVF